jgi:hypothetical protein
MIYKVKAFVIENILNLALLPSLVYILLPVNALSTRGTTPEIIVGPRKSLCTPFGGDLVIQDLLMPVWLVGETINDKHHSHLADGQNAIGGTGTRSLTASSDGVIDAAASASRTFCVIILDRQA